MDFYHGIFGGKLFSQTLGEALGENAPEDRKDKIMHASLSGGPVSFMASDGTRDKYEKSFITLSLAGKDKEELTNLFNKLAEGGQVNTPLKVESWGDIYGDLTDKFGVDWMVNISQS
jgi:PhnB protein